MASAEAQSARPARGPTARALGAVGRLLLRVPLPLALLPPVLWGFLIWRLSSHRAPLPTHVNALWDLISNLAHAPLFGSLTLLVAAVLLRESDAAWPRPRRARIALVLACTVAYGALDEWHQSFVPGRDASAFDVLTDLVSSAVVLWIVFSLGRTDLGERELWRRLGLGFLLCLAAAGLATLA